VAHEVDGAQVSDELDAPGDKGRWHPGRKQSRPEEARGTHETTARSGLRDAEREHQRSGQKAAGIRLSRSDGRSAAGIG